MSTPSRFAASLLLLAVGSLASCLTNHDSRSVAFDAILPWLRSGVTTRAELIERFGMPRRQLESGRILLFEIQEDGRPSQWAAPGAPFYGPYSLVVVIAEGRVERASMVRVWE